MSQVMKEWRSSTVPLRCGFDWEHTIRAGEPYLAVVVDALVVLIRCRACAQQYYPHDPLPPPAPEEQAS